MAGRQRRSKSPKKRRKINSRQMVTIPRAQYEHMLNWRNNATATRLSFSNTDSSEVSLFAPVLQPTKGMLKASMSQPARKLQNNEKPEKAPQLVNTSQVPIFGHVKQESKGKKLGKVLSDIRRTKSLFNKNNNNKKDSKNRKSTRRRFQTQSSPTLTETESDYFYDKIGNVLFEVVANNDEPM